MAAKRWMLHVGDRMMTLPRPVRRTRTARTRAAADARRHLATYQAIIKIMDESDGDPDEQGRLQHRAITELLWAQAKIEHALHNQTSGRLGDGMATPARIVERSTNDASGRQS